MPGGEQAFGEDVAIDRAVGTGRCHEHFAMFFEIHQPVGQGQVADIEHRAVVRKGRAIFAVRVNHDDMTFRRKVADAMQDQRGAGGFTGAGRSQKREMLAQHRVDIERRARVRRREYGADLHMGAVVGGVDLAHVLAAKREDFGAGRGIVGDAPAKAADAACLRFLIAFAQKVDVGDDEAAILPVEGHRPHAGDQPGRADAHFQLAAHLPGHGDAGVAVLGEGAQGGGVHQHLGTGAGDLENFTDAGGQRGCPLRLSLGKFGCCRHMAHKRSLAPPAKIRAVPANF